MQQDHAKLDWRGDVPIASAFDDPYYSFDDGLAETRYVFLDGNDLPARFCEGFHVAELGFGTGLNVAAVLHAWRQANMKGPLSVTSFELFPMALQDMRRALARYTELQFETDLLLAGLEEGRGAFETDLLKFTLIGGDARVTLPAWRGKADAWFLDGFAPAKNPELWEPELLHEVASHTVPGGSAATYTAAGDVRRALVDAGFVVDRRKGFGRKRHMTVARLP